MKRQGGDISSAVHDLLKDLVHLQGVPADHLAQELGVPEATLRAWLSGDLRGLEVSHVAALHKAASRPVQSEGSLQLAPPPSSFPPGTTVVEAVVTLDERLQRLEQSLAIQSDLLRQVWHLSDRGQGLPPDPAETDGLGFEGSPDDLPLATDERHDEWSRQLSTYAREGLISEAITILDELIGSQDGGGHAA